MISDYKAYNEKPVKKRLGQYESEIALCLAVLRQSLEDLGFQDQNWFLIDDMTQFNIRIDAYYTAIKWFMSDESNHCFSFAEICDLINISPQEGRRRIFKHVVYDPEIEKFLRWIIHRDYILRVHTYKIRPIYCYKCGGKITYNQQYYPQSPTQSMCYDCFINDKTIPNTERWIFNEREKQQEDEAAPWRVKRVYIRRASKGRKRKSN